jgi:hypothetical protein
MSTVQPGSEPPADTPARTARFLAEITRET